MHLIAVSVTKTINGKLVNHSGIMKGNLISRIAIEIIFYNCGLSKWHLSSTNLFNLIQNYLDPMIIKKFKFDYLLIRVTWLFLSNPKAWWIRALQKSTLKLFIASGFTSHVIAFIHSDSFIFNFKTFEIGTPRLKSATGRHYLGSCAQHLFPEFKAKFHQLLLLEFFLIWSEERLRAEIFFLRFETEKWNGKKFFLLQSSFLCFSFAAAGCSKCSKNERKFWEPWFCLSTFFRFVVGSIRNKKYFYQHHFGFG